MKAERSQTAMRMLVTNAVCPITRETLLGLSHGGPRRTSRKSQLPPPADFHFIPAPRVRKEAFERLVHFHSVVDPAFDSERFGLQSYRPCLTVLGEGQGRPCFDRTN